jgi:hypothetical protein
LGEVATDCEESKSFIGDTFGFARITALLQSSDIPFDIPLYLMLLELASIGSIRIALSVRSIEKINHSSVGK